MNNCRFDLTSIVIGLPNLSTIIPENMVEIGSRDGYDTEFISNHFQIQKDKCYIFEPNPEQCGKIIENYPKFQTYNQAISTYFGVRPFTIDQDNIGMSSLLHRSVENATHIEVECIPMLDVIKAFNLKSIDICKIDVEGSTMDVLKSFGDKLECVKSIQLESEIKEIWKGQELYCYVQTFLEKRGFTEVMYFRLSDSQIDSLWINNQYLK